MLRFRKERYFWPAGLTLSSIRDAVQAEKPDFQDPENREGYNAILEELKIRGAEENQWQPQRPARGRGGRW